MKYVDVLKMMDIFSGLPDDQLQKIASMLRERRVSAGSVVFQQGAVGDAMYIVEDGQVKCSTLDSSGREKVLYFYKNNQFFGEMALLSDQPRSATMTAMTDTKLLMLRKDDFEGFLATNMHVMRQMMKVIAERQLATNMRLTREQSEAAGPSSGQVITVFSPKGGVGKSTLAVNLAVALAQAHPDAVALVDLSLAFGHDALMLNLQPKSSLSATNPDALKKMDKDTMAYYLTPHSSTLKVMVGAARPEDGEVVSGDHAKAALETLARQFTYVVIDTSSSFSETNLAAIEVADPLVLVFSPEITALRDIRECQRIFIDLIHVPKEKVVYVLNNLFPYKLVGKDEIERTLQCKIAAEIPYGNDAPTKAALKGDALVQTQASNPLARAVLGLSRTVDRKTVATAAAAPQRRGFFGR